MNLQTARKDRSYPACPVQQEVKYRLLGREAHPTQRSLLTQARRPRDEPLNVQTLAPLADNLVKADSGGNRDVEARDDTLHRQANEHVTTAHDAFAEAGMLLAHY